MKRRKYIDNIGVEEANQKFIDRIGISVGKERVSVEESLDRITSEMIIAEYSSPNYNASAMDGIAVSMKDTLEARDGNPVILEEGMYSYVNTGNPISKVYDAVIMIEDIVELSDGSVEIIIPAKPWQHIRPIGEDIVKGEPVLFPNHEIRAQDIGALLSAGVMTIPVYKKPRVGIIPTGSEIVESADKLDYGKIMDSNSRMFSGMVTKWGGEPNRIPPIKDEYDVMLDVVKSMVEENDIVIINAGSSTGTKDYTAKVVEELGEVICHGIAIKPGKPTILGIIDGKPVIGIPGYPVSSFVAMETFVKPLVEKYQRKKEKKRDKIKVSLSRAIPSSLKHKEIVRMRLGYIGGELVGTPLARGAGVTMSLVKADALLSIPRNYEGYPKGEEVEVELMRPLDEIKEYLVSIGSHDIVMDLIADEINLSSTHVGSMGGVTAIKKGQTHIAPVHILNPLDGRYNEILLNKYFDDDMVIIKGVEREQGLIVPKGNPHNIEGVEDLKTGIRFMNRQRGAGTRVLLDYEIKRKEIETTEVNGYNREATTHMACAIAVKEGSADVAMGIKAAADVMELDFVSVGYESYDFLVGKEMLGDWRVEEFIGYLKSERFKEKLSEISGYRLGEVGSIVRKSESHEG